MSSAVLTAKCSGVKPLLSLALTSPPHESMKLRAKSAPAKAAQCKGVLSFLSRELIYSPYLKKNAIACGLSPYAATCSMLIFCVFYTIGLPPCFIRRSIIVKLPKKAAKCIGVKRSSHLVGLLIHSAK